MKAPEDRRGSHTQIAYLANPRTSGGSEDCRQLFVVNWVNVNVLQCFVWGLGTFSVFGVVEPRYNPNPKSLKL